MVDELPRIYDHFYDLVTKGTGPANEAVATIGGWLGQPAIDLSYLLAARFAIESSVAHDRVNDTAPPVAFLQRHALELALKRTLASCRSVAWWRSWAKLLEDDPTCDPPPAPKDPPNKHYLVLLAERLIAELPAVGFALPASVLDMARELDARDAGGVERFRYLTVNTKSGPQQSFPEKEALTLGETQVRLEGLWRECFIFEHRDLKGPATLTEDLTHAYLGETDHHDKVCRRTGCHG